MSGVDDEMMRRLTDAPLPPLSEMVKKWIVGRGYDSEPGVQLDMDTDELERLLNEEYYAGGEVEEEEVEVELEPEVKDIIKRRILERHPADLQARVASAAAELERKGGG